MHAEQAYLFRHALLRDAAYQLQLPGDRARLHGLAIDAIEMIFPVSADREVWAAELADHAALAQEHAPLVAEMATKEFEYLESGANYLARQFRYEEALRLHLRLSRHTLASGERRARALMDATKLSLRHGAVAQALALAEQALALANGIGQSVKARALAARGGCRQLLGNQEAALEDFEEARDEARRSSDPRLETECAVNCGAVLRSLGRHEECRALCTWGAQRARDLGNPELEGYALQTLANMHRELGEFDDAIRCYDASLRALETSGSRLRVSQALGHVAGLHIVRGDTKRGAEITLKSLDVAREINALRQQVTMQIQLAACMRELGNPAASVSASWQALQIAREIGDHGGQALALSELCSHYADDNNPETAQRCAEELQRILAHVSEKPIRCQAHGRLGDWHWKHGRFDRAEREYNCALATSRMTGDPGREAVWKSMVAMVKVRTGRTAEAEAEFREALHVLRSLGQAHNERTILEGWDDARKAAGLPLWMDQPHQPSP